MLAGRKLIFSERGIIREGQIEISLSEGDTMEENREKDSNKPKAKYIWDPQKLAWVQSEEAAPEEARAQIVAAEKEGDAVSEETLEEGRAVEASVGIAGLQYRGVWPRLGGALVDLVILIIIGAIINAVGKFPAYALPIYGLFYFVGFWWWRGQTPGKMLIGARVVRRDGMPVDVGRAFARYVFYLMPFFGPITFSATLVGRAGTLVMILLAIVGLVFEGFNREKRGIHDFIAGTVVINNRVPVSEPGEVAGAEPENPKVGEPGVDEPE